MKIAFIFSLRLTPYKKKKGWKWLQDLEKNSTLYCYGSSYIVRSMRNNHHNLLIWLQEYQSWTSFDEFLNWLHAARLVTIPMTCTCRTNLKTYVCKHSIGLMIHFDCYTISDPTKFQNFGEKMWMIERSKSSFM